MYDWMFRVETDASNLDVLLDIRRGVDDLSPLNGAFQIGDVTDHHPTVVHEEFLTLMGSWRLPGRYSPARVVRYVNPRYIHRHMYADIVVRCECGALVGRERDFCSMEGEHDHMDDCTSAWRNDARERLQERRVEWLEEATHLFMTQEEAAPRMGITQQGVDKMCSKYDFAWSEKRREGRQEAVDTWVRLNREYGHTYNEIAEAFGWKPKSLRDKVIRHGY